MRDKNIIYAQVLLLDGKIENWKICQDRKHHVFDWKAYWKRDRMDFYVMQTKIFKNEDIENDPEGNKFNQMVYAYLGARWINQYEYAEDFHGCKCIENTLEEYNQELIDLSESLSTSLGRNLSVMGRLS